MYKILYNTTRRPAVAFKKLAPEAFSTIYLADMGCINMIHFIGCCLFFLDFFLSPNNSSKKLEARFLESFGVPDVGLVCESVSVSGRTS